MKMLAAVGFCAVSLGVFGCAAQTSDDVTDAEGELRTQSKSVRCTAQSGEELAVVAASGGKSALLSLKPAANLYALSRSSGSLTTANRSWSWTGSGSSLTLASDLSGKWKRGTKSTDVTCKTMPAGEAASWKTANALADYADQIDGLADTVVGEMNHHKPKAYTVFVVETAKRGSLSLGQVARDSAGAVPGTDDAVSLLDENDTSFGGISAAYALGGGDDYGEWFQGASDGISLSSTVLPALTGAHGGFIAREKVTALSTLVDSAKPSAVELTVGAWTFFLPDAFPK